MTLQYLKTDNDNCRVYFTFGDQLYCLQKSFGLSYDLFYCTNEGEPIDKVDDSYIHFSMVTRKHNYRQTKTDIEVGWFLKNRSTENSLIAF